MLSLCDYFQQEAKKVYTNKVGDKRKDYGPHPAGIRFLNESKEPYYGQFRRNYFPIKKQTNNVHVQMDLMYRTYNCM